MENRKRDLMITEATREEFKVPKERCEELAYYQTVEDIKANLMAHCEGEKGVEENVDIVVDKICNNLESGKAQEDLQETVDICIQAEITKNNESPNEEEKTKEINSEKEGE